MMFSERHTSLSTAKDSIHYLDHAATSWPKPPGVAHAMVHFLEEVGANPGRSGHSLSIESARIVYDTREAVASIFGADDPLRVVFGLNITEGINLALHGLLKPGDHVITSSMEHNAVMRPLHDLSQQRVEMTRILCNPDGSLDPHQVALAIRPNTRLIILNHASNVCGRFCRSKRWGKLLVPTICSSWLTPLRQPACSPSTWKMMILIYWHLPGINPYTARWEPEA